MIFGSMTGLLCILFRRIGTYEESIIFVLLLTNALVWNLDLLGEKIARFSRRRYIEKTNKT
jgi:Na+-translocating ferredoxin:NAD+ oxidoreductase RnfD subunit